MIKFISVFCFLIFSQVWSAVDYGDSDYLHEKVSVPNLAKVRIWMDNISLLKGRGEVGHVSLETSNSYLSFWPSKCDGTVFSVPAVLVKTYEADYENEDNKAPTYVFLVRTETRKVDDMMLHYRTKYVERETEKMVYLRDNIQWYSLGNPTSASPGGVASRLFKLEDVAVDPTKQYFNCASFVAAALGLADGRFFADVLGSLGEVKRAALQAALDQYSNDSRESFFTWVASRVFPSIIFPSDLFDVFGLRIRRDIESVLDGLRIDALSIGQQESMLSVLKSRYLPSVSGHQDIFWRQVCSSRLTQIGADHLRLSLKTSVIAGDGERLKPKKVNTGCSIL